MKCYTCKKEYIYKGSEFCAECLNLFDILRKKTKRAVKRYLSKRI